MPRNPVTPSADPTWPATQTPARSQAPTEESGEVLLELRPDFVQQASVTFADQPGSGS